MTRLLVRLGADDDAVALHYALVNAGKPSPLSDAQVAALADDTVDCLSGAEAVIRARAALARFV